MTREVDGHSDPCTQVPPTNGATWSSLISSKDIASKSPFFLFIIILLNLHFPWLNPGPQSFVKQSAVQELAKFSLFEPAKITRCIYRAYFVHCSVNATQIIEAHVQ